jgi:hypothetical protein
MPAQADAGPDTSSTCRPALSPRSSSGARLGTPLAVNTPQDLLQRRSAMSYASALASVEAALVATVRTVNATIAVTDEGPLGLSFTSFNPLVTVKGTDISLTPGPDTPTPVNFNLLFVASTGIASFLTPAAEIQLDGNKVGYTVSPNSGGSSFTLSFLNNLPEGNPQIPYAFTIFWISSLRASYQKLLKSEDPTILMDPPKS